MKLIPLTQGQFAMVDDEDYEWLNQWKWLAQKTKTGQYYAARSSSRKEGKSFLILMHRFVMGLKKDDKQEIDHHDHNGLNNQRYNLRYCTHQQNTQNVGALKTKIYSKYKGVRWHKTKRKYYAGIRSNGKLIHLGSYKSEIEAAFAYDKAALTIQGEFACINFP